MQIDLYLANHIVFADGCSLKTLNTVTRETTNIAGNSTICGYEENIGTKARFRIITSFSQLNQTHLILTDIYNHCIRMVNRYNNATTTWAGECGTNGTTMGKLLEARFHLPEEVLLSETEQKIYLAESQAIKIIDITLNIVSLFVELSDAPLAITFDRRQRFIYVATRRIVKVRIGIRASTLITTPMEKGYANGPFEISKFNGTLSAILLNDNTMITVDYGNNRLRILDFNKSTTSSICNGNGVLAQRGDALRCQIPEPYSLLLFNKSTVLVGGKGSIYRLQVSGMQCNSCHTICIIIITNWQYTPF